MNLFKKAICVASLVLLTLAHPMRETEPAMARALYTITNEKDNSVVALRIGSDGKFPACASIHLTPTGGLGSNGILNTNESAAPDALFSQSALTIAANVSTQTLVF